MFLSVSSSRNYADTSDLETEDFLLSSDEAAEIEDILKFYQGEASDDLDAVLERLDREATADENEWSIEPASGVAAADNAADAADDDDDDWSDYPDESELATSAQANAAGGFDNSDYSSIELEDWQLVEGEADLSMNFYDDDTDNSHNNSVTVTAGATGTASGTAPTLASSGKGKVDAESDRQSLNAKSAGSAEMQALLDSPEEEARQKRIKKLKKVREITLLCQEFSA